MVVVRWYYMGICTTLAKYWLMTRFCVMASIMVQLTVLRMLVLHWWCSCCGSCQLILHGDMTTLAEYWLVTRFCVMASVMVQLTVLWMLGLHSGGEVVRLSSVEFIINFWKKWIGLYFHKIHQYISNVLKCKIQFCLWFYLQFHLWFCLNTLHRFGLWFVFWCYLRFDIRFCILPFHIMKPS